METTTEIRIQISRAPGTYDVTARIIRGATVLATGKGRSESRAWSAACQALGSQDLDAAQRAFAAQIGYFSF